MAKRISIDGTYEIQTAATMQMKDEQNDTCESTQTLRDSETDSEPDFLFALCLEFAGHDKAIEAEDGITQKACAEQTDFDVTPIDRIMDLAGS